MCKKQKEQEFSQSLDKEGVPIVARKSTGSQELACMWLTPASFRVAPPALPGVSPMHRTRNQP